MFNATYSYKSSIFLEKIMSRSFSDVEKNNVNLQAECLNFCVELCFFNKLQFPHNYQVNAYCPHFFLFKTTAVQNVIYLLHISQKITLLSLYRSK